MAGACPNPNPNPNPNPHPHPNPNPNPSTLTQELNMAGSMCSSRRSQVPTWLGVRGWGLGLRLGLGLGLGVGLGKGLPVDPLQEAGDEGLDLAEARGGQALGGGVAEHLVRV